MTFKTLLIAKAVVCLVLGPILVFAPGWLFGLLGTTLGSGGTFTAREYGAAVFGSLMLTWLARNTTEPGARRASLIGLSVYEGIGLLLTLQAVALALSNPLGRGIVSSASSSHRTPPVSCS